jgi:hypothetical protein
MKANLTPGAISTVGGLRIGAGCWLLGRAPAQKKPAARWNLACVGLNVQRPIRKDGAFATATWMLNERRSLYFAQL